MGRTYKQPGRILDFLNGSGGNIAVGDPVVLEDSVGIALVDIPDGESGAVSIEGVHEVPKATGTAWALGQKVSWDSSADAFAIDQSAAGDVQHCGIAAANAAAGDTLGLVRLTPGTGTAGSGA